MLNIKKYANGRFFDTAAKKYIKPEKLAEMIQKGEEIKITLTKTGKDVTNSVIKEFSKKEDKKKGKEDKKTEKKKTESSFLKTDRLMNWLGEVVDTRIEKVMNAVKLPTKDQVAKLDQNIKQLNKNIDALIASQEKTAAPKKSAAEKKPVSDKLNGEK